MEATVSVNFFSLFTLISAGGWCRPQTDAPGLRAITLIAYANDLIKRGNRNFVTQYLWTGDSSSYNGGAIKVTIAIPGRTHAFSL